MACCHQAPSHYLSQCWSSSKLPHGISKWQWDANTGGLGYFPISCQPFSRSPLIRKNVFAIFLPGKIWRKHFQFCSQTFTCSWLSTVNSLKSRQNGLHFADNIFKCIFLDENVWIPIEISLEFVSKGPINNIPALVQIMAWRRPGDKPLSEPMMVSLPTHICVAWPQWVKSSAFCWNSDDQYWSNIYIYIYMELVC